MSYFEAHCLYGQKLRDKLIAAGVLEKIQDNSRFKCDNIYMLHFARCNAEEWAKDLQKALEHGVIDCSKQKPDGSGYGLRRDYTPEEQAKLGQWPVRFNEDGSEMSWYCKWIPNQDPAYYASWALPNEKLIFQQHFEVQFDGGGYLKNGTKFVDIPGIQDGSVKEILQAAVNALTEAGLNDFADEMLRRCGEVTEAEDGRTYGDQKVAIILDYMYIIPNESSNMDDAYTEEEKQVPAGPTMEPDPDLPF